MTKEFQQADLSGRNSFHVKQRAARLVEFETADDLRALFAAGKPPPRQVEAGQPKAECARRRIRAERGARAVVL